MEWTDEGIVLSAKPHGENAAVVIMLTAKHGRHTGLVPGGQGKRMRPLLQTGNHVKVKWRARIADQLGTFSIELITPHAARWLEHPEILAIISSACAVTETALPDRQPMPEVYSGLLALLGWPDAALWAPAYVKWETELLRALGYGLDLSKCAVNGTTENLSHVSPRTGRAVSREAAEPYRDKLFALPGFLCGTSETWTKEDIANGLELTGHFLSRHVFSKTNEPYEQKLRLPAARERLADFYRNK